MATSVNFDTSAKLLNSQQNNQHVNAQSKYTSGTPIQKQLSSGSTSQSQWPVTSFSQFVTNSFRQSPVKHTTSLGNNDNTPLLDVKQHSEGKQSTMHQKKSEETQIFQSNDDQEEEYQESDNQEDGGDPIFAGDSDFEPAEQSINLQSKYSIQKGNFTSQNYFDVVTNNSYANQFEFEQDSTYDLGNQYKDDIDYKLMQEHEISSYNINNQRPLDNSDAIYRLRSSAQSQINLQNQNSHNFDRANSNRDVKYKNFINDTTKTNLNSSHYSSDNSSAQSENNQHQQYFITDSNHKQSFTDKSQFNQESKQQTYELGTGFTSKEISISNNSIPKPQVIQNNSEKAIVGGSSNVRRFARGTAPYQSSFSKPQNTGQQVEEQSVCYDKFYRSKNDNSFSSQDNEENEIFINNEFKGQLYNDTYSKSTTEKQSTSKQFSQNSIEPDFFDQAQIARNNQKQAASNLATIRNSNNCNYELVDDDNARFKSTAVGFSPNISQVYGYNQVKVNEQSQESFNLNQPTKSITSFGLNQNELITRIQPSPNSRTATFETGGLSECKMQDMERAQQLGQYARLYPQMEYSRDTFEMQSRNVQASQINSQTKQKEKRKKKKEQAPEAHFLLTGQLAQYLEQRSYFRNQSADTKQKNLAQQVSDVPEDNAADPGNPQALKEWFESLSLQDRVNSLTTTYPIFVNSIIEAQSKNYSNGPLCLFQLKKDKVSEVAPPEQTTGRRRVGQQNETEYTILERVSNQDDQFRGHNNFYGDQSTTRQSQTKIIKYCRITSNKNSNDTLTVCQDLVKDSQDFFGLLDVITDGKAFQNSISYVTRNGAGGRPVIQSPKWVDNKKINYLGVWIVAILEETLWAHFNFARSVNISQGVRKNELNQLFELRSDNLNNQEDLAKRWTELGDEGQQKLITKLSQIASQKPPQQFHKEFDEKEHQNQIYPQYSSYQHYNEDIYKYCNQQQKYGLYQFQETVRSHNTDIYRTDIESPYFNRAQANYFEQQGLMTGISQAQNHSKYINVMHNDTDLKDIVDTISYIDALKSIKFLSEFPLQEVNQRKYIRRQYLCEQLNDLIKESLRQSIQDQLMNDLLANEQHKTTNVQDTNDQKNKSKKNKDVRKNKNKKMTQTTVPTYQKKKSISKSPIRQQIIVSQQPQVQKETQKPTSKNQQQVKQQENKETASRVASTTTSDDQTAIVSQKQVEQKVQQLKQQQRKDKKQIEVKKTTMQKQQQDESQNAVRELISVLMNEIVESVCQIEEERINKLSELALPVVETQLITQIAPSEDAKSDEQKAEKQKEEAKDLEVKEGALQEKTKRKRRNNQQKKKEQLVNNFIREKFQLADSVESSSHQANANKNSKPKQGSNINSSSAQNKGALNQTQQSNKEHQSKQSKNQHQNQYSKSTLKSNSNKDSQTADKNDKKAMQSLSQAVNGQQTLCKQDTQGNSKHSNSATSLASKNSDQIQPKEPINTAQPTAQPVAQSNHKPIMSETQTILVFNIDPTNIVQTPIEEVAQVNLINDQVKDFVETKPIRESISLTDHFIQQPLDLNDFREFQVSNDVFDKNQNTQIYENSKVKYIDYSAQEPRIQVPFQWQADQTSDNSKIGMSTTSVSFTPTLQLSPQLSHVSCEDDIQKQHPQELYQFMPNSNSPPSMNKFNSSPQSQVQNQSNLLNNDSFHRQQFAQMPIQLTTNFEQQQKSHYQPQSYRQHQPDYSHTVKGQGVYKKQAPFRSQNYNQYAQSPQNYFGSKYQPHAQQQEYPQYPINDYNFNTRPAKNVSYQNKKPAEEFGFNQNLQFQDSKYASQIRLDAPSFDPVQFQNNAINAQDFTKQNWSQIHNTGNHKEQTKKSEQQYQSVVFKDASVQIEQTPLYIDLQKQFYRSFDKDIKKSTEKVLSIIERFKEERKYVKKRLQFMADAAFPGRNPKIKIFGSIKTGLALETSDMDIAVTGLSIDSREQMIDYLNAMADQVQKWSLIKDFKAIETASIPVIKANLRYKDISDEMGKPYINADPNAELPIDITFDDSPVQSQIVHIQHQPISLDPMTQLQNLLQGELGLKNDPLMGYGIDYGGPPQPKTHLGLASCDLLKYYVSVYPCLKEVALLLKRFLAVNNLNHPYMGGISSYSAVLLIVAYMNEYQLHRDPNLTPSLLLNGFLDFYSNHFNPKVFGVNTTDGMSFFLLPQQNQHMFVIVDPVNLTNNTARNSFRTPEVLDHFRAAYQSLKNQITMRYYKIIETEKKQQSVHDLTASKLSETQISQTPVTQQIKVEKTSDGIGQRARHGAHKKGHAQSQFDPTATKASEQQQPSSNQAGQTVSNANQLLPKNATATSAGLVQQASAQAFDSLNLVQCFLSLDIMKEGGKDKQLEMGSYVNQVAF